MPVFYIHGWASDSSIWPIQFMSPSVFYYDSFESFPDLQDLAQAFLHFWQCQKVGEAAVSKTLGIEKNPREHRVHRGFAFLNINVWRTGKLYALF